MVEAILLDVAVEDGMAVEAPGSLLLPFLIPAAAAAAAAAAAFVELLLILCTEEYDSVNTARKPTSAT